MKSSNLRMRLVTTQGVFGMKRTLLVGVSMFLITFGASAQVGNVQNLESFKATWMVENSLQQLSDAQYEQMKTEWLQTVESAELTSKFASINAERGLPADYPVKMHTGDEVADEDSYQLAKALWIANNQAVYDQMMSTATPPTEVQLLERAQTLSNQNN